MLFLQGEPAFGQRQFECAVGQFGKIIGQHFDRERALQILCEQAEHLGVVRFAQRVHLRFDIASACLQLR